MNHQEAEQLALDLMASHGLISDGWAFQWSRGKRQLGCAQVRRVRNPRTGCVTTIKTIKLSRHLVALNNDDEVRDTILHEIAHALAGVDNGHNAVWRAVCRRIGAKPQRQADSGVKVVQGRYVIVCSHCQSELGRRHRRMNPKRLAASYCKDCGPASKGKLAFRDTAAG